MGKSTQPEGTVCGTAGKALGGPVGSSSVHVSKDIDLGASIDQ